MIKKPKASNLNIFTAKLEPSLEKGEHIASKIRLIIVVIGLIFIGVYLLDGNQSVDNSTIIAGLVLVLWAFVSGFYLLLIHKKLFRPFIATISITVDILVVTTLHIIYLVSLPLSFTTDTITMVCFVIIGLTSLRKSKLLVIYSGIGCGLSHILVTSIGYFYFMSSSSINIDVDGNNLKTIFIDEIGISLEYIIFAVIISYVTNKLRQSEKHYLHLFENTPNGIAIVASSKKIIAVNKRMSTMIGLPREQIINKKIINFLKHKLVAERIEKPSRFDYAEAATILQQANGKEIQIQITTVPILLKGDKCLGISIRDVTQQIELEHKLAQSQKMDTIGVLANSLAHDFNNILGGILGATSLAKHTINNLEQSTQKTKLTRYISSILDCGDNASNILDRLLSFSRTTIIETSPLELYKIANDTADICKNSFNSNIVISIIKPDYSIAAKGHKTSLTQALLNLFINAKDAIGSKEGHITVKIYEIADISAYSNPNINLTTNYCCIEVTDSGKGMDKITLSQIFDPFFSTKPKGEGTGLGLPMVYNIARQHGGFIDVSSSVGQGTTFKFFLQRSRDSLLPPPNTTNIAPEYALNILLADDDEIVNDTIKEMLLQLGHNVSIASNGKEALNLVKLNNANFDLIILDIIMPVMDGVSALKEIRKIDNDVKIIMTSAFVNKQNKHEIEPNNISGYLSKPYTISMLSQAINDALSS